MIEKTLEELEEIYDFELAKVVSSILDSKAKIVLLQFPDGLKPYAPAVVDYLREKTSAEFLIWIGSCFGACDLPTGVDKMSPKIDLTIQFGHSSLMPDY